MDFNSFKAKVNKDVKDAEDAAAKKTESAEQSVKNTVDSAKNAATTEEKNIASKIKKPW